MQSQEVSLISHNITVHMAGNHETLSYLFKGMFHMITMLTSMAYIDIREYQKTFKYPKTSIVALFWLLLTQKIGMRSQIFA